MRGDFFPKKSQGTKVRLVKRMSVLGGMGLQYVVYTANSTSPTYALAALAYMFSFMESVGLKTPFRLRSRPDICHGELCGVFLAYHRT
jgi:hypothetical protein